MFPNLLLELLLLLSANIEHYFQTLFGLHKCLALRGLLFEVESKIVQRGFEL